MERAFWIVSLIILLTDAVFITVNYHGAQATLYESLADIGRQRETNFHLSLRDQGLHMQAFATYLASQPEIVKLFLKGRDAVLEEGGGPGGEKAAAIRQQLFDIVSPGWHKLTGNYRVRQLHFHIGPGDTSFLRVHKPSKFGDDLSPIRHTITHAINKNILTHGFESGRVYAGIRGVTPITTQDSEGREFVAGALEAGSSFSQMLKILEIDTGSSYSVLLDDDYFHNTHWPSFADAQKKRRPMIGPWFIEATSNEQTVRELMKDQKVVDALSARLPVISHLDGIPYAFYSFPFRDYLREKSPDLAPIGTVLSWQNAKAAIDNLNSGLRTNLLLGVFGFVLVETLLYIAWTLLRGRLQRVIDTQVHELSETNQALQSEIELRTRAEKDLIKHKDHLESLVEDRTHSLKKTVTALTGEVQYRKQIEDLLQQERDQAQVTLRSIADGVITADTQGYVEYMNPAAEKLTGWSPSKAIGKRLTEVFRARDVDQGEQELEFESCLSKGCQQQHSENTELTQRDGKILIVEHSVSMIVDEAGVKKGLVLVFHDNTETRNLAVKLSHQASHDALTGLINRRAFEYELYEVLKTSRTKDEKHAFLYIDLDQFKIVNDTCGHVAGDELLRQVAKLFQKITRKTDSFARLGGDEFGLLLRNCNVDKAREIGEEFLELLQGFRFGWEDRSFKIGASIGIALLDGQVESIQKIMSEADAACYLAKEKGRSRVQLSLPDDNEIITRQNEMNWVSRIQEALAEDRFVLYSQEIVPVSPEGNEIPHREILVRMLDMQGGVIPPNAFIPAAERYGLMHEIDRWIINRALYMMSEFQHLWPDEPLAKYSINLSGETMAVDGTLEYILSKLEQHHIDPRRICFEVTETAAIANLASAIELMTALKREGCQFALDDFGSGLSSFSYLKNLPVDFLKIDGSFVRTLHKDKLDRVMVRSINEVGHAMNLKTIAEFVENDDILQILRELQVDYAQGYGISSTTALYDR